MLRAVRSRFSCWHAPHHTAPYSITRGSAVVGVGARRGKQRERAHQHMRQWSSHRHAASVQPLRDRSLDTETTRAIRGCRSMAPTSRREPRGSRACCNPALDRQVRVALGLERGTSFA
jgi:hypothetical protein